MPIFEYHCGKCGNKFEELVQGDRNRTIPCPQCGSSDTEKLMSAIGGISMGGSQSTPCGSSGCASPASCCSSGSCPHAG
ncbi:MAG: zinc ribbon domain-containing protein [Chitinispirillaceae bacterium]|nr:zinc ribbon domain-containing protein [Chitinispirillaceae bacterium]